MQKYFNNVADQNGNAISGANVSVAKNPGPTVIYSDNGVTPIVGNFLTTDANGYFAFYAPDGRYNISITATGITPQSITDILLEDSPSSFSQPTGSSLVGFIQSGTGAVARTVQSKDRDVVSVKDFGAVGDGSTNDYAAFAAALASGATYVKVPHANYRLSTGIVIPAGVQLVGQGGVMAGASGAGGTASVGGSRLVFDVSVATCVTLGGSGANNGTAGLRGITVDRATGTPPGGSVGILVQNLQMPVLNDVYALNHAIPYYFLAQGTAGLGVWLTRCFSAAASDAHMVIDGYPEWRANQCRIGMNGAIDVNSNAYIRIKGGGAGSGSGPNTIVLENCQFNQANSTKAAAMLSFESLTITAQKVSTVKMTDCYAENYTVAIKTDSTVTSITRFSVKGCTLSATTGVTTPKIFDLNAATVINEWEFVGNEFFGNDFTIGPTTINSLSLVGNRFGLPVSITCGAASNSTTTLAGNTYLNGGLTVAGNGWASLSIIGEAMQNGSTLTNTAQPENAVNVVVPLQSIRSWTPQINFGGLNTGITYSTQSGGYQVIGNMVVAQFRIIMTSKGTATGAATIIGLPFGQNAASFQTGGGGVLTTDSGFSGLTAPVMLQAVTGVNHGINMFSQGATGIGNITDTNFTATTNLSGHVIFFI